MYFFSVTGIDNLSFSVTIPTQVLATAVAVGHEFPFQRYVTSGTDVVSMTIREHHYFSNWKFHAVFCKVHEQMPEKRRRKGYIRRCVLRNSRRFFHASPAAYSHHLNSSGNKSANSHEYRTFIFKSSFQSGNCSPASYRWIVRMSQERSSAIWYCATPAFSRACWSGFSGCPPHTRVGMSFFFHTVSSFHVFLRLYRTFPQFLQNRSEESFNVPQSGQYHLPSGIGSTGEGVWCAFAGVWLDGAVNNGAIFTSLRPTPARLLKSHDLTSCASVRFGSIYWPHRWQYRTPSLFS